MDIQKCQVFTPPPIVAQLLDILDYRNGVVGRTISENSCGDGNVLVEVVHRYIQDARQQQMTTEAIKGGLERDIYACEINERHREKCIHRLDEVASQYGFENIHWNVSGEDFLQQGIAESFDFVVGNPPYIAYPELNIETRNRVREKFESCKKGKFDYCYAFIEASLRSLSPNGRMAYLVPSNIFKNVFAASLRELLLTHLTAIYDFKGKKLFEKLTATSIILCESKPKMDTIEYNDMISNRRIDIRRDAFVGKWQFAAEINEQPAGNATVRFGDYFHAATAVATLCNRVFLLGDYVETDGETIIVGETHQVEKALLRPAVSARAKSNHKNEYIIFPYAYGEDGGLLRYSIEEFETRFPNGAKYLRQYKKILSERDSDKGINWFEYGRSQALAHLNRQKLLLSTLVTGEIRLHDVTTESIPSSGIFIIPLGEKDLAMAKRILQGEEFLAYVKRMGVISNGNSYRISPVDINNYLFPRDQLAEEVRQHNDG